MNYRLLGVDMQICFVTGGSFDWAWQEKLDAISGSQLIVFGFNGLGLFSYKKELAGETEYFQDVAKLSKQLGSVVISGCDTDTYGVFRHSVAIADRGKILGVTDMAHSIDDGEFVSGGNLRVYDTGAGKIGIIVQEDLFFPETARVLTLCDADIIICIFKKVENHVPNLMLRAGAFSNGVLMALCADNYASVSNIKGEILLASPKDIIKTQLKIEKDYHLIVSRRRGMYREFSSDY